MICVLAPQFSPGPEFDKAALGCPRGQAFVGECDRQGIARPQLFSESAGRFVVTVSPEKAEAFEKTLAGSAFARVGEVTDEGSLHLKGLGSGTVVESTIAELKKSWQTPLAGI